MTTWRSASTLGVLSVVSTASSFGHRSSGAHPAPVSAYTHCLALDPDPAVVEKRFAASVRRNIRASEKRGVEVVKIESEHEFIAAYWPLHVATRRRLGRDAAAAPILPPVLAADAES